MSEPNCWKLVRLEARVIAFRDSEKGRGSIAGVKVTRADELFAYYHDPKNNSPLKKFLHIIEGAPNYPVVVDAEDRV